MPLAFYDAGIAAVDVIDLPAAAQYFITVGSSASRAKGIMHRQAGDIHTPPAIKALLNFTAFDILEKNKTVCEHKGSNGRRSPIGGK